jgi:hypothetical protein
MDLKHLGGNAVNLLYQYKGMLPVFDWRNLILYCLNQDALDERMHRIME